MTSNDVAGGHGADHPTPETVDRSLVAAVVPHVELRNVRLDWCHAAVNCNYLEVPTEWVSSAVVLADAHYAGLKSDSDGFVAYCFIQLRWTGDERPIDDGDADVEVSAIFELDYDLPSDVTFDSQTLEHFSVFNGTFNAWPYWREFVQSTTQRLGVTPFVMPVMRISSPSKRQETAATAQRRSKAST